MDVFGPINIYWEWSIPFILLIASKLTYQLDDDTQVSTCRSLIYISSIEFAMIMSYLQYDAVIKVHFVFDRCASIYEIKAFPVEETWEK